MKKLSIIALALGMCVAGVLSSGAIRAQSTEPTDCIDDVSDFQEQVQKCLMDSKTFDDAQGCWEM
jgi:hypothetical protein